MTRASLVSIDMSLKMLWRLVEEKEKMGQEIILTGEPLKDKVKLMITIKGITPLVSNASPYLSEYYANLTNRRGAGRARIALIRKLCGIMRRMLLNGEKFRWINADNFERKLKKYERELIKIKEERKSA